MTRTKWSRRTSKDVQRLSLGPALRGLGHVMGASAAPRHEFRIDLRERLIEEARLIALQPKTGPPRRRARRPKGGGGIRLAAIGIGFGLAGGGVVAAAHSLSLPAAPGVTAARAGPSHPLAVRHRAPSPPAATSIPPFTAQHVEHVLLARPPATSAAPSAPKTTSKAALPAVAASLVPSAVPSANPLPGLVPTAGASPIIRGGPVQPAPGTGEPAPPSLIPSLLGPSPGLSANPFPEVSPLP